MPRRATDARRRGSIVQVPCKVHKRNIADEHIRRPRRSTIVTTVLRNSSTTPCAVDTEVGEEHVRDAPPTTSTGLVVGLVVTVAAGDEVAYPCLEVDGIANVVLSTTLDDRGIVDPNIGH